MSGRAYRPTSSNRGSLVVLLCVVGSVGLHGVAYGVLRHIRKPRVEERPPETVIHERKAPRRKRKVRLLKPRIPPMAPLPMAPPRRSPHKVARVRSPMRRPPPMAAPPMAAPPMAAPPIDLTPMGAGVDPSLVSENGVGSVGVGSTAVGDPTVVPSRRRPSPMGPPPMATAPPPPRRRVVVYVKTLPVQLRVPRVPYPRAAKLAGVEGTVKLKVTVGKTGKVLRVRVLKRLGHGLDEAAVRALMRALFKPAVGSDGKPMVYTVIYRYTFRLEQ